MYDENEGGETATDKQNAENNLFLAHLNLRLEGPLDDLKLFMATPMACTMRFYAVHRFWDGSLLGLGDDEVDRGDNDPFLELTNLNRRLLLLDDELLASLVSNRLADHRLAKTAYLYDSETTTPVFQHGILRLAVLDRMAFALLNDPKMMADVHRAPLVSWSETGHHACAKIPMDPWQAILTGFLECLPNREEDDGARSPLGINPVVSLATYAHRSGQHARYNIVKQNFCLASLGLIALCLPPEGKKEKENIVQYLLRAVDNEETTEFLRYKYKDYELLKGIYFAAAASPFCLLTTLRMSPDNSSKRVSLSDLFHSLRRSDPAAYTRHRLVIENILFKTIAKMAKNGQGAFDDGMRDLRAMWSFLSDHSDDDGSEWCDVIVEDDQFPIRRSGLFAWTTGKNCLAGMAEARIEGMTERKSIARCILDYACRDEEDMVYGGSSSSIAGGYTGDDDHGEDDERQNGNAATLRQKRSRGHVDEEESSRPRVRVVLGERPSPELSTVTETVTERRERWTPRIYGLDFRRDGGLRSLLETASSNFQNLTNNVALNDLINVVFENQVDPQNAGNSLQVFAGDDWDAKGSCGRRTAASQAIILVIRNAAPPLNVKRWRDSDLDAFMDCYEERVVVDCSADPQDSDARYHRASVHELVQGVLRKDYRTLRSSFIPITSSATSLRTGDVDDVSPILFSERADDEPWRTSASSGKIFGEKWAHVAADSSVLEYHSAPAGLATYLTPVINSIVVCIPEQSVPLDRGVLAFATAGAKWLVLHVRPGWELFLPPGVGYIEMSFKDGLVLGGHFYSSSCMSHTLDSMIEQHYRWFQPDIPFRKHAPLMLMKLLDWINRVLRSGGGGGRSERFPSWADIAALLILIAHLDQLAPQGCTTPWQASDEFKSDHEYAMQVVHDMLASEGSSILPELGRLNAIYEAKVQYLNRLFEGYSHLTKINYIKLGVRQ